MSSELDNPSAGPGPAAESADAPSAAGTVPETADAATPLTESADPPKTAPAEAAAGTTLVAMDPNAAPPASEDIHMPAGSVLPLLMALGITMALVGVTIGWIWTILGGLLFLTVLFIWIRSTKHELDHFPDEAGSPGHH